MAKPSRPAAPRPRTSTRAKAREGKVAVMGYFSPELSKRLNLIRVAEDKTLQALVGEAIDLLLVDRGQDPANER